MPMLVRKFFLSLAAFSFLSIYLFLVYQVLAPFFAPLAWAAIIAIATFPLFRRVRSRLGGNGNRAAAMVTPAVILLLALPVLTICFFLLLEVDNLLDLLQVRMATEGGPTMGEIEEIPGIAPVLEFFRPIMEDLGISLQETAAPALQNLVSGMVEKSKSLAVVSFKAVVGAFVLAISLFFFYRDGERMMELFWSVIPLPEEQKILLGSTVENILSAVLYGLFLTAIIQGLIALAGYLVAGLPSPVLLGALTVIAALIPGFGTAIVWLPGALYLLFTGKIIKGTFLLLWGAIAVATTDNFIRPYFISGRGGIPFLTVLLGVLGGLAAFGFVGMVLGPMVLALFFAILSIYRELLPPGAATAEGNPAEPDEEQ
jgi:predicted PurR-regulated permease PerM